MTIKILALAGSLRKGSFNKKLLRQAMQIAREAGAEVTEFDISQIPLYNFDLEEQGFPTPVIKLRQAIAECDLIMLSSPEYNHSIPGVMKNAIDWASRPPSQPFAGKIGIVFGASDGGFGTVRTQIDYRKVFATLNVLLVPQPQVTISYAEEAFDEKERLKDRKQAEKLSKLIHNGLTLATKLKAD